VAVVSLGKAEGPCIPHDAAPSASTIIGMRKVFTGRMLPLIGQGRRCNMPRSAALDAANAMFVPTALGPRAPSTKRWPLRAARLLTSCLLVAALCAGSLLSACGGAQSTGPVRFTRTAKTNYDRGVAELERKATDRARRYFKHVRRHFPYSRYAAQSELRLADCEFADESFAEAAASYRRFMRLHPSHADIDHAAFRRGKSFYELIPSDWFLVPPSHERDMSATRDALRELRGFLRQFSDSDLAEDAEELARDCLARLARHEMYVARFYLRRGKHLAAIGRTRIIERRLSDSGAVPGAMFLRGETYIRMEEPDNARDTFLDLIADHPSSHEAERAREYLNHMGVEVREALATRRAEEHEEEDP